MSARGDGKGAITERHRRALRDDIQGLMKPVVRRLARRGGVKRLSGVSGLLKVLLENIVDTAAEDMTAARDELLVAMSETKTYVQEELFDAIQTAKWFAESREEVDFDDVAQMVVFHERKDVVTAHVKAVQTSIRIVHERIQAMQHVFGPAAGVEEHTTTKALVKAVESDVMSVQNAWEALEDDVACAMEAEEDSEEEDLHNEARGSSLRVSPPPLSRS